MISPPYPAGERTSTSPVPGRPSAFSTWPRSARIASSWPLTR
jgi:hypothetical protein